MKKDSLILGLALSVLLMACGGKETAEDVQLSLQSAEPVESTELVEREDAEQSAEAEESESIAPAESTAQEETEPEEDVEASAVLAVPTRQDLENTNWRWSGSLPDCDYGYVFLNLWSDETDGQRDGMLLVQHDDEEFPREIYYGTWDFQMKSESYGTLNLDLVRQDGTEYQEGEEAVRICDAFPAVYPTNFDSFSCLLLNTGEEGTELPMQGGTGIDAAPIFYIYEPAG